MNRTAVAILGLALALRLACDTGRRIGDEFEYGWYAANPGAMFDGTHRGMRWPLILAERVNAGAIVGLLASLGQVALAYAFARRAHSERAGLLAAVAVAVVPVEVLQATAVLPDVPAAALMALSVWLAASGRPWRAGLALGAAHLFKESAVFAVPVLAALAWRRRDARALVAFAAVVAIEAAAYGALAGDPLARWLSAATGGHRAFMLGYAARPGWVGQRAFLHLPAMLWTPLHEHSPYVGVAGLAWLASLRAWRRARLLAGWAALVLLAWNFWPSSAWPYVPAVRILGRYLAPAVVPMMALVGVALADAWPRRTVRAAAAAGAAIQVALCLVLYAYHFELTGRFNAVCEAVAGRAPAMVVTDARSYWQVRSRLPASIQVHTYDSAPRRLPSGTLVLVHELNARYARREGEPLRAVDPAWRVVYDEAATSPLHAWRSRAAGYPARLHDPAYRIVVYEVP